MAATPRALVLGYHDITSAAVPCSGFGNPEASRYKTAEADFRAHVARLAAAPPVTPITIGSAAELRVLSVFYGLTFDDGGASALLIADILQAQGWRGHFFVVTQRIGSEGFLTVRAVRELALRGHVVGSHSHTHPSLMASMPIDAVREEWNRSRTMLEDILGAPVSTASVPGGSTSKMVEAAAAASGIEVLFTSEPTARVVERDGCLVVGRYQLYGSDSAQSVRAIVDGSRGPRLVRTAHWKSRRLAQRALGKHYLRLRHALLK